MARGASEAEAEAHFREAVFVVMFAGYHGTSALAYDSLNFILNDPQSRVRLFRADPKAFVLEVACSKVAHKNT